MAAMDEVLDVNKDGFVSKNDLMKILKLEGEYNHSYCFFIYSR